MSNENQSEANPHSTFDVGRSMLISFKRKMWLGRQLVTELFWHLNMNYHIIDHTADFGLHVFGATEKALYENAAAAMFEQIVDTGALTGEATLEIVVEGEDRADLMVSWLRELLYLWTGKEMLLKTVRVDRLTPQMLAARVTCDAFHPDLHAIKNEIKAVTYHQIQVVSGADGWEARVIFDV
jgi:SHS2 domain-containing protein